MVNVEIVVDLKNRLGESPVWDCLEERLYWVDTISCTIYSARFDGREIRAWITPNKVGSIALREGGGAIIALENGLHFLDLDSGRTDFVIDPETEYPTNRLNDGKVDRSGRFVFGSIAGEDTGKSASLYRLDRDLTVHKLESDLFNTNGPCWSPDGRIFYFCHSATREILSYDYDPQSGCITNRQVFSRVASHGGTPDGATVDAEGYHWNARPYAGQIVRTSPSGEVDRVIDMPTLSVTSLTFGGPRLDMLFVTSMARKSRASRPQDPSPLRGSLFAIRGLGVSGLPEQRFTG